MNLREKSVNAWGLVDAKGVRKGNAILWRAGLLLDLRAPRDLETHAAHAMLDLLTELSMGELRSLAKFWACPRKTRNKRELAVAICATWVESVHATERPRSNYAMVTRECPAKWCR